MSPSDVFMTNHQKDIRDAIVIILLCIGLMLLANICAKGEVFEVSAYCNEGTNGCKICCGKWAELNQTASGRAPVAGITIAAPRRFKLGTTLNIEGVGVRRVDDRLAKKYDHRIDLFFSRHSDAKKWGVKKLNVEFVK